MAALKAAGQAVILANQKRRTMEGITKILLDAMDYDKQLADVIEQVGDEKIKKIDDLLFKLGCLMRKKDIEEEKSKTKSADALVAKLKAKAKEKPKTLVAKKISGRFGWLAKHGGSKKRYAATSSKKCDAKGYGTGYEAGGLVKGLTAVAKGVAAVGSVAADIACGLDKLGGGTACGIGGSSTKGEGKKEKKEKKKEAPKKPATDKKKLREEMPAYLLNAITKEKPAHPKYGKLRY